MSARPGELLRNPAAVRARVGSLLSWHRYRREHFGRLARYRYGQAPNARNYSEEGY